MTCSRAINWSFRSQTTPLSPMAGADPRGSGRWPFFVSVPMLEHKAHAFLHGICAQRPSHSLQVGDELLPFDARMTGIYTGFLSDLSC